MKKMIPLYLALFSIALFLGMIARHEWRLAHSDSIFVRLMPADPRSLLQGDYMALNYQLYFSGLAPQDDSFPARSSAEVAAEDFKNKPQVLAYVQLDGQRRVIKTGFDEKMLAAYPASSAKLILKNPNNSFESLYPAADSFLFAEGLEPCYRNARFAELKVQANGQPLLAGLADENLKALNCEQRGEWWKGS